MIVVKGMNGDEFGRQGDFGLIVFRESINVRVRKFEVVVVLMGGKLYELSD